jgi:hypothetical protein
VWSPKPEESLPGGYLKKRNNQPTIGMEFSIGKFFNFFTNSVIL